MTAIRLDQCRGAKDGGTYKAVALVALPNMTRYCGGYGFTLTGLGAEECRRAAERWFLKARRKLRGVFGDGIADMTLKSLEGVLGRGLMVLGTDVGVDERSLG